MQSDNSHSDFYTAGFVYARAALAGTAIAGILMAVSSQPSYSLHVEGPAVPIEPVGLNEAVDVTYTLLNQNSRPVVVDAVSVSCACVSVDKDRFTVAPASAERLKITVKAPDVSGTYDFDVVCSSVRSRAPVARIKGSIVVDGEAVAAPR